MPIAQVLLLIAAAVNVFYAGVCYANGYPRVALALIALAALAMSLLLIVTFLYGPCT